MEQTTRPTCCSPQLKVPTTKQPRAAPPAPRGKHQIEQAKVPGGSFTMGDHYADGNPGDGEIPVHPVVIEAFEMDATCVTNDAFAAFVQDTGYVTEAQLFGYSAVFYLAVRAPATDLLGSPAGTPWWVGVRGADWAHPAGRKSDLEGLGDHPVVHVTWNDATAYCAWAGRRLPTEAQWEIAARGGLSGMRYPWGNNLKTDAKWSCNIWQGDFPSENTEEDGFMTTAPVRSYEPNGYGLWQMVGNVWEWCADRYNPRYYSQSPTNNPEGPAHGSTRSMRGGSYLCHDSYCNRYRVAARSSNTPDSSMGNAGFRTISAIPLHIEQQQPNQP